MKPGHSPESTKAEKEKLERLLRETFNAAWDVINLWGDPKGAGLQTMNAAIAALEKEVRRGGRVMAGLEDWG